MALRADTASAVDVRDTLVPVVSAVTGAVLALMLREAFPAMAGLTAAIAGAAAGVLLLRRNSVLSAEPVLKDQRIARIRALETQLACERAMHESFKAEAAAREAELQRFLADTEMTRCMLEGHASQSVELAEEMAQQKQRSDYLANHDPLTGLPNRRGFEAELARRVKYAAGSGLTVALLFIDLDRFKDVNDALGHEAGDSLLQRVASLFGTAMRHDDFAARVGGDEFAVIVEVPPQEAREVTSGVAERLRLELQIAVPGPDGAIPIGATIGVALFPQDAASAEGLLHAADQVMYVGKRHGRNRVVTTAELKAGLPK
ncbi:MAG TPA: GGDEF domain-containing protein [Dongiaceae bacterium]|nr:GGDEF domain-containing protein [Dongiaceae bacterium]